MNEGRWTVCLFGGLRVEPGRDRAADEAEAAGRTLTRFSTQKTAALLAYLAFYGERSHPREVLIELFWPGDNMQAGRHSLSMALSSLRHQLEPPGVPAGAVIQADRQNVGLNSQAVTTDVGRFEQALKAAARAGVTAKEKAARLAEALAAHGGPLLPGFYDEWVLNEQGRLETQFIEAASTLAALREEAGDSTGSITALQAAVQADPLNEKPQFQLLSLLHRSGQTGEALRRYQELARRLEEETGSIPGPELRQLLRRMETHRGQVVATEEPERIVSAPIVPTLPSAHAPALPIGTVTFLYLDWKEAVAATADAPLAEAFRKNGGFPLPSEEATPQRWVFAAAGDALEAALAAGRALSADGATRLPRLVLHTGDVPADTALIEAAAAERTERLLAAGHAGQLLLSEATVALLRPPSPQSVPGAQFTDLGLFRLPDADAPVRLFRASHPDLPMAAADTLPPPRAETAYQANLPLTFTRFFGREREIDNLTRLLSDPACRLLTLTGPGGTGKTRLSLQAAQRLIPHFHGRVCFVPLADVTEAQRLPDAIITALRLPPAHQQTPLAQIASHFTEPALLVLDNVEQIATDGATVIDELLRAAPTLSLLVTSRQLLQLEAEREYLLGPLPAPSATIHRPDQLHLFESAQVFVDRAQAVRPDFQITVHNAPAIAALCERLEGLPLALELAASRAQVLTPAQMLEQLANRFEFLVSRRADKAPRHRSLRAAIEWSYRLLDPTLARFFTRLSVFRGGWTQEAAEEICDEPLALDALAQLRECSLILSEETTDGTMRFRMLETIREYAAAQLSDSETQQLQTKHRNAFLALAEKAREGLAGPQQAQWLTLLEADHANLRAALDFTTSDPKEGAEVNLRLVAALVPFWLYRGYLREGAEYLEAALASEPSEDKESILARASALSGAAEIAWIRGDVPKARTFLEQCVALRRALGEPRGIATALNNLGNIAAGQEDLVSARALYEESLGLHRGLGHTVGIARTLNNLGALVARMGDLAAARAHFEESLELRRQVADPRGLAIALVNLGNIEVDSGDTVAARRCYQECLRLCQGLGEKNGLTYALDGFADVCRAEGDLLKAARLYGATDGLRNAAEIRLPPSEVARRERGIHAARTALGEDDFRQAFTEGEQLGWEEACCVVLRER